MKQEALRELKRHFRPEFINRIDEIVVFDKLSPEHLRQICRLLIEELNQSLARNGIRVCINDELLDFFIERSESDRQYGARPLRRLVQRQIEDPLAEYIVATERLVTGEAVFQRQGESLTLTFLPSSLGAADINDEEAVECGPTA
jgi:ATP-dependent Clp protease ATP-binding subunit ClpA